MKVSDYVASFLEEKGIKDIFTLSGGFCLPLLDSIGKSNINHVCNLHEQAVAVGAEAYAQYTDKPGVCVVTAGPGGTNTITGIASAWLDSIPMIAFSGQVQSKDIKGDRKVRQIGFQEIDIVSIVKPITKYAVTLLDPYNVKKVLEEAWHSATTGRQGPVWIEIPLDIQSFQIDETKLEGFTPQEDLDKGLRQGLLKQKVSYFYELLNKSKRPIILAGNGVRSSKAIDSFLELAKALNIPILTTPGFLSRTPDDMTIILDSVTGKHSLDPYSLELKSNFQNFEIKDSEIKNIKIGWLSDINSNYKFENEILEICERYYFLDL